MSTILSTIKNIISHSYTSMYTKYKYTYMSTILSTIEIYTLIQIYLSKDLFRYCKMLSILVVLKELV